MFRAHGTDIPREIWQFGEPGSVWYDNQLKYIRLRYRLLPYIYSVSYMVSSVGASMMKPLVLDFTADRNVYGNGCSYMFGPSFLVRPVSSPVSEEPEVSTYLPGDCLWYDFNSGRVLEGGKTDVQPSRIDVLPLYVKAGSIIPMAEVKQWADEYPDSSLELRVYAGADGSFLWYDDEGDSYRYLDGECSKVLLEWRDWSRTLVIGGREGSYDGMPGTVEMDVKLWLPSGEVLEKKVSYSGRRMEVVFE